MIAALLLAAAAPSAVDAELAFARDAQRLGQWTAFRKWAGQDAVVFTPQAAWAREVLPKKDPPKAISWRPAHSFVSCDGRTAVNTGPWFGLNGKMGGYFTTVWQRTRAGWRWAYDGGGPLAKGAPVPAAKAQVHRASCRAKAPGAPVIPPPALTPRQAMMTPDDNGRGESADKTLGWDWKVEKGGARHLRVFQWNGTRYEQVLYNDVPAPPPPPEKQ
ncbi:hypothetical protein [Sphingomonas segetis]|jgi:hypothetical protein|uniref:hypothetical protein n=1 Tax=Sphingomonas segetis TaxID=1104779 RepID=UPI0012D2FE69|nr:hypothetical protein [Sphingomonas segetis]